MIALPFFPVLIHQIIHQWLKSRQALITSVFILTVLFLCFCYTQTPTLHAQESGGPHTLYVVDPDGLNQVPVRADGQSSLTATLYSLSADAFLQRYLTTSSAWDAIDTSGLTPALTWTAPITGTTYGGLHTLPLPPLAGDNRMVPSGIYVLQTPGVGWHENRAYLLVSRHTLVVKQGNKGQVVLWATTLQTKQPVAEMEITLYDNNGVALATGRTNADGLLTLNVGTASPRIAIGRHGAEMTLAGIDWQWRQEGHSWSWSEPNAERYRVYLYTDRPLYRPDQSLHYHAIIRNNDLAGYTPLDSATPITVTLRDSRNNLLDTATVHADDFGTVHGTFTLSDEPPLGEYRLALTINGETTTQPLYVEEYRKPEYAVSVETPATFALHGDTIPLTVQSDYYFGQPVANATVVVNIYRQPLYRYYSWWDKEYHEYYGRRELVESRTGQTDGTGGYQFTDTPSALDTENGSGYHYTYIATVTDARDLPVMGMGAINVYARGFTLRARTEKYGYAVREEVVLQVSTSEHDGTPRANQRVTVRVVKPAYEKENDVDMVPPQTLATDAAGNVSVRYSTLPQGWYSVVVTSIDDQGKTVEATRHLWIYGNESNQSWWYHDDNTLTLMADRDSYAPGDVAQLLIQSNVMGTALLTLERDGVHSERIIPITGPVTTVALPITADYAPNIHAKIHLYQITGSETERPIHPDDKEGHLLTAEAELAVPVPEKRLIVTFTDLAASYTPGAEAPLTLQVTDQNGVPVQAQVAVAIVDEALFALREDLAGDLFDTFYGARANGVATFDSQAYTFYWDLWQRDGPPTTLDDVAGDEAAATRQTRRNFQDTAYWNPTLQTDAAGRVTFTVPLPDNLTTWRLVARAVTKATEVGETRSQLLVTQELIARPALPRFAVVGDRFQTGVVAQNYTGTETTATTTMTAQTLTLLDPAGQQLTLPYNGTAIVQWTAVASLPGTDLVTTTVATSHGSDEVELVLPIKPFAVPDRWVTAGIAAPSATATFTMPHNAIRETTTLALHLSPSLAAGVTEGLDALIAYPYGCVEQTMSRLLPTAVAATAFTQMGIETPRADELPAIITSGLQKIYGFQHEDGSWGWFYDDDGGVYLTTYVLLGLHAVQQAGFAVEAAVIDRGFAYVDQHLATVTEPGTKAYALYVKALAERGNLAAAQALVGQRSEMDSAMQAALALALYHGGDTANARQVTQGLRNTVSETPTTAYWPLPQTNWQWQQWQTMASTEKNTALALQALSTIEPETPLLPKVVRWLMQQRRGSGWSNTQATAFAVMGLVNYALVHETAGNEYTYRVLINGETVDTGTVSADTRTLPPILLHGEQLYTGENILVIERSEGSGTLYYTALLERQLYHESFVAVESVDQGLQLSRSYRLLEGTPRTDGAYNVGDLIEVSLQLTAQTRMAYVHVEDPIPAGFEVINERLNAVSYPGEAENYWSYWRDWGYNRKNVRDDRVDFFVTTLWPGTQTLTYRMRAITPGEFSVLPGQTYPMYNDEIWGRSAATAVRIVPEALTDAPNLTGDFDHNCRITPFDLQLAAAAWGTWDEAYNLVGEASIDLADLAAIGSRTGATCKTDRVALGMGASTVSFQSTAPAQSRWIGEPIVVTIRQQDWANLQTKAATTLGGYGFTIHFDATQLSVADVQWHNRQLGSIPLGPVIDTTTGTLQIGSYQLDAVSAGQQADTPLVTITFIGHSVGLTEITLSAAEALDGDGHQLATNVTNEIGTIAIEGNRVLLPVINR